MSSSALNDTKPITKNLSEFKADLYSKIPSIELVVFAIQVLQHDDIPATTEEIVSICFRLFPQSFSLKNYFYWPDSALVARRLQDAREKGYIKGIPADGFALKMTGKQTAKRTAKLIGFVFPKPPRIETPAPPTPAEVESAKTASAPLKADVPETKKAEPPVKKKKKTAVKPATAPAQQRKTAPKKVTRGKKIKPKTKPTAQKKIKRVDVKKASPVKAVVQAKKAPGKKAPAVSVGKKKLVAQKKEAPRPKPKSAKPAQLTMALLMPPAKKKPEAPASKPKVEKEAKPVKAQSVSPVVQISKEEKDKAGKIVKLMERSDAYQQYKKNGGRARISEFDFRNMLYATMESSAETLKRNVELFKRYAGIHNRADLITFLSFCEESFAPLLNAKQPAKRLKI